MKTIIHAFDVDASGEAVREALTSLSGLRGWWSTVVGGSADPGSVIEFTFRDDFNPRMQVEESGSKVVWRCVAGHEPWADNTFHFELGGDGPVSVLFRQEYARELSDKAYGIYNFNWGFYLESLRLYVETGRGKPFEP
jgi:hypothetical protein